MTAGPPPVGEALSRPADVGQAEALTPWDDYPVHQSSELLSRVSPSLPGWAERFYFNVLRPTGEIAAIVGGGVYPLRGISECYFCRIDGDRQRNVRAWQRLPAPGGEARAGPFSLRCERPLERWNVTVDLPDARFDGDFSGIAPPYLYALFDVPSSEPDGPFDLFRHFVALGRWEKLELAGLDVPAGSLGVRDRTWGVRTRRVRLHNWYVFELDGACLTVVHQELGDGSVLFSEAGVMRPDGAVERLRVDGHDLVFEPRDRQIVRGRMELSGDSGPLTLELERVGQPIRLAGAGYDDSQGDRGVASGVQRDDFDLADPEVSARTGRGTMDAGARARVTGAWSAEGTGVVETAIARDHVRYGSQIA